MNRVFTISQSDRDENLQETPIQFRTEIGDDGRFNLSAKQLDGWVLLAIVYPSGGELVLQTQSRTEIRSLPGLVFENREWQTI